MTTRMVSFAAPGTERVYVLWPLCQEHLGRARAELAIRDSEASLHVSNEPASTECHYCQLEEKSA